MKKHNRLLSLIMVLGIVTLAVTGSSLWILYQAALDQQGRWLHDIVLDQAALFEAQTDHYLTHTPNTSPEPPENLSQDIIKQFVSSFRNKDNSIETLEIVVGHKKNNRIHLTLTHLETLDLRQPPPLDINNPDDIPMQLALAGKSGIVEGPDYSGNKVLAAYTYLPKLKIGLVAKVDLVKIHEPFVQALAVATGIAVLFITIGVFFFTRINDGIVIELTRTIAEKTKELRHELDERIKTEQQLKRSEEKHIRILENLGTGHLVYVRDSTGNFTYLSPSLFDMLGYRYDEFQKGFRSFLTDNPQNKKALELARDSLRGIEPPKYELEIKHKNGALRILEVTETPVFDEKGDISGVEGIAQDITERKRYETALQKNHDDLEQRVHERTQHLNHEIAQRKTMEKALRISEERFKDIARSTSNWFYELDSDLRFTYISDQFFNITGVSPGRVIGKTRQELLKDQKINDDHEMWLAHFDDLKNHRPFQNLEYAVRNDDGKVSYIQVGGIPVFGEYGEFLGYRGAGRDITERKLAEETLKAAMENAQKADRAKTDFLSQMSHELRTPLNAIIGLSELLQEEAEDQNDEMFLEPLRRIHRAGKHLLNLINDILDLTRYEAGNLDVTIDDFDLYLLAQSLSKSCQEEARKHNNTIKVKSAEHGAPITSDMVKVRHILGNLTNNACKYTENGAIDIVITKTTLENAPAWQIDIIDEGIGIKDNLLEETFKLLSPSADKPDRIQGGVGLSLAVADRFTRLLGGHLSARRNREKGSTFTVILPVNNKKPENR